MPTAPSVICPATLIHISAGHSLQDGLARIARRSALARDGDLLQNPANNPLRAGPLPLADQPAADDAMREHGNREAFDVIGYDIIPAFG
jgi:hypothetical protein